MKKLIKLQVDGAQIMSVAARVSKKRSSSMGLVPDEKGILLSSLDNPNS